MQAARHFDVPPTTIYDALLLEVSNFHIEVWIDCLKLKYFMKKIHEKAEGKLYRALSEDIAKSDETGFIGDVRNLCKKYKLPDITLLPVTPEHVSEMCKDLSRRRSMMVSLTMKKMLPMFTPGEIFSHHYYYPMVEARAITCLRTGNLIFKNWAPWHIKPQYKGDNKCLFQPCQEKDCLQHVLKCEFYDTKFKEGKESPIRDWADYVVALHNERITKFGQPLISFDGWSRNV